MAKNIDDEIDIIFEGILSKNALAKHIKQHSDTMRASPWMIERLKEIEKSLALAINNLGAHDNQPSVEGIMESEYSR